MAKITVTQPGTTVVVGDGDTVIIDIPGGGEVTIVADPNDNVEKVKIEFVNDNEADTVNIDLSTFSEPDLHIDIKDYDPTDTINLMGAFNRHVDPGDVDEYQFDYIGADGETYSGFVHAKDKGEKDFTAADPPIIICFGRGTLIGTPTGEVAVETLRTGDLVNSDAGPVPVRWIGSSTLDTITLLREPHLRPIVVRRGALGLGRPGRDLTLSPNHRLLISDWRAEMYFGEDSVLVPVKALANGTSIATHPEIGPVTYYHLLLDGHRIVMSNGLPSESLFLGAQSLEALAPAALEEIRALLGEAEFDRRQQALAAAPLIRFRAGTCLAA